MDTHAIELFVKDVKRIVSTGHRTNKIVASLRKIGFYEVNDGNAHFHLKHSYLGGAKMTIPSSPSSQNWSKGFVSEVRHAMWKYAA